MRPVVSAQKGKADANRVTPRLVEKSARAVHRAAFSPGRAQALCWAPQGSAAVFRNVSRAATDGGAQRVSNKSGPSRKVELQAAQGVTRERALRPVTEEQRSDAPQIGLSGDGRTY